MEDVKLMMSQDLFGYIFWIKLCVHPLEFVVFKVQSLSHKKMSCPYHGGHAFLVQKFTQDLVYQEYYFVWKLHTSAWSKENAVKSLWERVWGAQRTDKNFEQFYQFLDWLYGEIGMLTTSAYVKEAFDNVVLSYHPVKNEHTNIQLGCFNCQAMTNPLRIRSYAVEHVHLVMYEFFKPYFDSVKREKFFMDLWTPPLPTKLLRGTNNSKLNMYKINAELAHR